METDRMIERLRQIEQAPKVADVAYLAWALREILVPSTPIAPGTIGSGRAATLLGVTPSNVRYLVKQGLLMPVGRTARGHARFDERYVRKFALERGAIEL
jgi:hypothetical protein